MQNLVELFKQYYVWYFGIGFVFAIIHYYILQRNVVRRSRFENGVHVTLRGYILTLLRIPFYPIFILDSIIKIIANI